jgi:6-pyruvoyltetrahydropterin/6-carboxytetrahydropterin synthase
MLISSEFHFCAAHWLPRHPGKCRRLHGHNYLVVVELEGPVDVQSQFVMDYCDLKNIVDPIIERWDHRCLNAFIRYSSAENIAAHLADLIRANLYIDIDRLVVRVSETPKTWAVWDSARREDILMLDRAEENAEWKSPTVNIVLSASKTPQEIINEMDIEVLQQMNELTHSVIVREQTALYYETLDKNPELPKEVKGRPQ